MKINEILNEKSKNMLLAWLDKVLGFEDKIKSTVRKLSQKYDNQTNEHVVYLEYRVRVDGHGKPSKENSPRKDKTLRKKIASLTKKLAD